MGWKVKSPRPFLGAPFSSECRVSGRAQLLAGSYGFPDDTSSGFFWHGNAVNNIAYPRPEPLQPVASMIRETSLKYSTRDGLHYDGNYCLIIFAGRLTEQFRPLH